MDDFSFEDAGDQLDDDIAEAIRVSLVEATAPSPHSAEKTLNQGMFLNKVNFYCLFQRNLNLQTLMTSTKTPEYWLKFCQKVRKNTKKKIG